MSEDSSPVKKLMRRSTTQILYLPVLGQRYRVLSPDGLIIRSAFDLKDSTLVGVFANGEMVTILQCREENLNSRIRLQVVSEAGVEGWITYAIFESGEVFLAVAPEDL